jgi:hypothetical protein
VTCTVVLCVCSPLTCCQVPLLKLPLERCIGFASNWRPVPYNAPDCVDLDSDCRARAIAGQCDSQQEMTQRCQLSCGLCRQVSSSPGCYDRDASCLVAASVQGRCQNDTEAMGPQGLGCLLSCGQCSAVPPPSASPLLPSPSPSPSVSPLPSPSPWWVQAAADAIKL